MTLVECAKIFANIRRLIEKICTRKSQLKQQRFWNYLKICSQSVKKYVILSLESQIGKSVRHLNRNTIQLHIIAV